MGGRGRVGMSGKGETSNEPRRNHRPHPRRPSPVPHLSPSPNPYAGRWMCALCPGVAIRQVPPNDETGYGWCGSPVVGEGPGMSLKKHIAITKREPLKCVVCGSTNVEYTITFKDPSVSYPVLCELPTRTIQQIPMTHSCVEHVGGATAALLQKQGLIKMNPQYHSQNQSPDPQ